MRHHSRFTKNRPKPSTFDTKYPQQLRTNNQRHQHYTRSTSTPDPDAPGPAQALHSFAYFGNAINPDTNQPAEYLELSQCSEGKAWIQSQSEEFGRLMKGNGTTILHGTDTMRFIGRHELPPNTKPTYMKIVVADRPEKPNPKRVRNTIGGNLIHYDGDTSTKAAELSTCKLFFNSILSTPGAKCLTGDLKDFYLQTARMPQKDYAYMIVPINIIPDDIIAQYNVLQLAHNDKVYIEVSKGIYGLPQAGKLANEQLQRHLSPFGYTPCPHTAGLWRHSTRNISFLLVVDDFAIKYTDTTDVTHLLDALQTEYKMSTDWTATRYCGLIIKWDYEQRTCDISMPGYIERALTRFQHPKPTKPQHNPVKFIQPEYGAKIQYDNEADTSDKLDRKDQKRIQEILGTLLYYARAVDPTLLVTVSSLARQQKDPTINTSHESC